MKDWLSQPGDSGFEDEANTLTVKIQSLIVKAYRDHGALFLIAFATALVCHGFHGAAVTLEFEGYGAISARLDQISSNYSGVGRYFLYFLSRHISTASYTPWLTMILACALLSVSAVVFVRLLRDRTDLAAGLAAAIFVAVPFFALALPLWLWSLAFSISYLTAVIAAYLTVRRGAVISSTILLVATLLNYQPALGFFMIAAACYAVYLVTERKWREAKAVLLPAAARSVLALLAAFIVYALTLQIGADNDYTEQQTGLISSPVDLISNIASSYAMIGRVFMERGIFHDYYPWVLAALFFLAVSRAGLKIVQVNTDRVATVFAAGVVAGAFALMPLAIAPFNVVLDQQTWFDRTLVAAAALVAFLTLFSVGSRLAIISLPALALSVVSLWWFAQANNVNAFSQYAMNSYDQATAERMADHIVALEDYDPSVQYQLVAVDPNWRQRSPATGSAQFSPIIRYAFVGEFAFWSRNVFAMAGLHNVTASSNPGEVRLRHEDAIATMDVWPKPGSVMIVEDRYVLVRYR
ncbi:glucosyltransferase domain-containing protein [Maricaulaceae bacterium EIL42A08]|nr:glucosyltransferase domain-containing protein [Maricaulaceae bacterium EIL42A08]